MSRAQVPTSMAPVKPIRANKRKRCQVCPSKKDCKTHNICRRCEKYVCRGCTLLYCPACANSSSECGTV
ncbi:piggyBac transposable element-derived protein 4 [Lates japonicus]|uniref:PiggyBac transposable element-derived protein 4 n=1 Tax=Lates japonicus TaxID=270547 RepID=A0AAD3M3J4_LATJO|nr:piggyBac transposable element-derived protein 4 [Lates japonicus]